MAENLNTLYYALGLDDHEMQEGLKKAIQNLSVLDDEFNRINKAIEDTFGKKIKNAPIHNEIKGLKGELQALEKQWNALTLAERRGAEGQRIRAEYEAIRKEAGNLNNSLARLYSESQKAASGQKGLAAQFGLVNKELTLQSRLMSNVKTLFTTYISIFAVKSFIQNLAQVRGEFENQQIALRAILRDAEAADRIFGQIKSFAVVSPFEFKDLVGYAKQLSAFQVPVNELFETTKRLADVSAGLGVGMDRIILAYGQVRSAAVLRGQELRQFTEAGIPLVDELAKKFSELEGRVVSAGDVFEKISNRMVSFEMVKEIFEDMTNEGGMFYMMQEKQAESLKGKISNLADAYDIMLNDIGQANDGILKGGVEGIAALFSNWEKVWKVLKTVIATYGTYKAVLISVAAIQKVGMATTMASEYLKMAKNLGIATANMMAFNRASLVNPYTLIATSIGALVGGLILFNDTAKSTQEIIQDLENDINKLESPIQNINTLINNYEVLTGKVNRDRQEQEELNKTITQLSKTVKDSASSFDAQGNALDVNINKVKEYRDALIETAKIESQKALGEAEKRISELEQRRDELQKAVSTGRGQTQQLETGELIDFEYSENAINKFKSELLSIEVEYGNLSAKIVEYNNKISDSNKRLSTDKGFSDWQKNLNDAIYKLDISQNFKDIYSVRDFKDTFETLKNNVVQEYQRLSDELGRINKTSGIFEKEDVDDVKKRFGEINKLLLLYGGLDRKGGSSDKDPNAERLQEQIDLIKKAQAQYEKYLEIMSPDEALNAIRTDQQFMALDVQFEPDKVRERLQMVMNDIGKLPKSPELEKLKKSIQVAFTDIDYADAKKNFDQFLGDLTKELDTYKDKYNFYEQLLGITGDQNLAVNLAFNGNFENAGKGIIEQIQQGMMEAASDTGLTLDQIMNLDFTKSAQDLGISEKLKNFLQKSVDEIGKINFAKVLDAAKLVADYQSIQDKINTIIRNGAKEQEDIEKNRNIAGDELTDKAIEASKKKTRQQVAALESESFKLTTFYQQLFGDISSYGNKSLDFLINKTQSILSQLQTGDTKTQLKEKGVVDIEVDNQKLQLTESDIAKLTKRLGELNKEASGRNPFRELSTGINDYKKATDEVTKAQEKYDNATTDAEKATAKLALEKSKFEQNNSFVKMFNSAAEAAGELANSVGGISDILGTLGVDMDGAGGAIVGGLQQTLGSLASIDITKPFSIISGAIGAVGGIFKSIFGSKDAKLDKKIKASEREVRRLQNAYSDLERAIDKSLGTDKYAYTSEQVKNLQQQQAEVALQAQAERDKKKSDQDKVADLERQYKELGDQIQDVLDNIRDEVIGSTADEIAQELGNAFFEAFAAGEDYAEAWGSKVKDIVADIVKRMLIDKLLDKEIGKAIEEYSARWMDSAGNIDTDKVIETSEGFYNRLMGISDGFASAIDALTQDPFFMELLGPGSKAGQGLSEGIKGITEDTAQLLASYLNAIRGSVLLQELYMKNIDTNVAGIYQAMGGSPSITTTTTIPPEIIAAISEPFKLNNSLLASIDANMANVHSISANALAQIVLIQANTYNTVMELKRCADYLESVIMPGHPKGGSGVNVFA